MTEIEILLLILCSLTTGTLAFAIATFSSRINTAYKKIAEINKKQILLSRAKPKNSYKKDRTLKGYITLYDRGRTVRVQAKFERNQ